MQNEFIYLDNASTTRPDSRVVEEMMNYLMFDYGNPSSRHKIGIKAKEALELARTRVSEFLDCNCEDLIFTSGGSEANNLMINQICSWCIEHRKEHKTSSEYIMVSDLEHDSVLRAIEWLPKFIKVMKIPVTKRGCVDIEFIKENAPKCTACIVMGANNETGIINDIKSIAKICHESECKFTTDCVQLAGCKKISVKDVDCDIMTISSHKLYGCKGAGAVYIKDLKAQPKTKPSVIGGKYQEMGLRSGTENIPAIVGFGKACDILSNEKRDISDTYRELYDCFIEKLFKLSKLYNLDSVIRVNGDRSLSCFKTVSLTISDIDSESLVFLLSGLYNVYISSGSACHNNSSDPSRALTSMGLTDEDARSTIRVSFSKYLTKSDVCDAADKILRAVIELYGIMQIDLINI